MRDLDHDAPSDVALNLEQIRSTSDLVVSGCPQLGSRGGVGQTSGHTDASLGFSDTSLQDVPDSQFAM
ncbi:MAG: hypothetical protein ACREJ0_28375, partial [Geminicoccaceae bacterium]